MTRLPSSQLCMGFCEVDNVFASNVGTTVKNNKVGRLMEYFTIISYGLWLF